MAKRTLPAYPTDLKAQRRFRVLNDVAKENGWRFVQDTTLRMLDGSSLYHLTHLHWQYQNHLIGDGWEYVEISFKARGQAGLNRFKKRQVTYAVMSTQLPRKLPNVVFDSLKHKRRQFRIVFDQKQFIQLEGNFYKYFDTYFGAGYAVDDLSFITPEVMESLMSARDYDIEIVHDSLLLFGQIQTDPAAQILAMSSHLTEIKRKLRNNIMAYQDDRVADGKGRQVVARSGMFLKRGPVSHIVSICMGILLYGAILTILAYVLITTLSAP